MDDQTRTELEAAAFRGLVEHLQNRTDVQNIRLMGLAGFCRNCLAKWYGRPPRADVEMDYDRAREIVYGMPFPEWKEKHQSEASGEQKRKFEETNRCTQDQRPLINRTNPSPLLIGGRRGRTIAGVTQFSRRANGTPIPQTHSGTQAFNEESKASAPRLVGPISRRPDFGARGQGNSHIWKWDGIREKMLRAGDLITAKEAERRVLMLENPAYPGEAKATETLFSGIQMILPGEVAPAHRHSPNALRLILEGSGGYTSVNGERPSWNSATTSSPRTGAGTTTATRAASR